METNKLNRDSLELNELGTEEEQDVPEETPKDKQEATPFTIGEQQIELSNGSYEVKIHLTNTTPDVAANISVWLLNQLKGEPQNKKGASYLG
jgi:hypothetical protein